MKHAGQVRVESEAIVDFARLARGRSYPLARGASGGYALSHAESCRVSIDQDGVRNGLGRLVLTLVKLLHELLERQAIRRVDRGSLTAAEIESLGNTLMRQAQEIERLRKEFGLEEDDLALDLRPLVELL